MINVTMTILFKFKWLFTVGDQLDKLCFFGIPPHCKTLRGKIDCVIEFLLNWCT